MSTSKTPRNWLFVYGFAALLPEDVGGYVGVGDHPGESVVHDVGEGGNGSVGAVGAVGAGGKVSAPPAVGGDGISVPSSPGMDVDSPASLGAGSTVDDVELVEFPGTAVPVSSCRNRSSISHSMKTALPSSLLFMMDIIFSSRVSSLGFNKKVFQDHFFSFKGG